jgi:hypothetical protein
VALVAAALLGAAGCGGSEDPPSAPPAPGEITTTATVATDPAARVLALINAGPTVWGEPDLRGVITQVFDQTPPRERRAAAPALIAELGRLEQESRIPPGAAARTADFVRATYPEAAADGP